ncbi:hypothetical protein GCM10027160_02230 [Streptomyces calidiresistens]|uniref:DUF4015 domain-containing protein n=1 Tax=Streptomyces calidiresistens TaxID=1485586 RepID=A0A7W3T4A6_9ACTN|nr:putative glycoside hydrolase [Streptomyces calidiresistens]MBB0230700.1 hypothetical protein [Streptomyces calidiresistens]
MSLGRIAEPEPSPEGSGRTSRRPSRGLLVPLALLPVLVLIGVLIAFSPWSGSASEPEIRGLPEGEVFNARTLEGAELSIHGSGVAEADIRLNDEPVDARRAGDGVVLNVSELDDGEYTLRVAADATATRTFAVRTAPPELSLDPIEADAPGEPVTVTGTAPGAVTVALDTPDTGTGDDHGEAAPAAPDGPAAEPVEPDADGAFALPVDNPGATLRVVATDEAGNTTTAEVEISIGFPVIRAAHLTASAWAHDGLREPVLDLVREGKLTAVQLDIKDESGEIGYDSQVPLAREIGAVRALYDAREAIEEIHEAGGEVVGRIVAFRDPILARASWENGLRDRVVQTPAGEPYGANTAYGSLSFTNFADPDTRRYHVDLAAEAAELGFDDILYDYIRRPDGRLDGQVFPGLGDLTPEESIVAFTADTREVVRAHGARLGVSVYGIAATRPTEIAQDIPAMAEHVDYIAPMIYPSHWGPGEYGVANPDAQPYDITHRSLADFTAITEGTGVEIVPWLQDFSMGVRYGPQEVADQIRAAADNDMPSFLLWNAGARYQAEALDIAAEALAGD